MNKFLMPLIVATIAGIVNMATDIYAPSLPIISDEFGVDEATTQLTISLNLIGLALSGLIYGPLSDAYGRRIILLTGTTIFTVASLICFFPMPLETFMLFRFIQGIGAGVAFVIGFAVVSDLYDKKESARVLSILGVILALSPGIAPLLGGYIAELYNWRYTFLLVFLLSLMSLIFAIFKFKETLPESGRHSLNPSKLVAAYVNVIKNKDFMITSIVRVLAIGWLWGEFGNVPFILVDSMGLSINYFGYYMFVVALVYAFGSFINSRIVERVGVEQMVLAGLVLVAVSTAILAYLAKIEALDFYSIVLLKIPASIGLSWIITNSMAISLNFVKRNSGTATAFIMATQFIAGSIVVYFLGVVFDGTMLPIALVEFILTAISLVIFWRAHKDHG